MTDDSGDEPADNSADEPDDAPLSDLARRISDRRESTPADATDTADLDVDPSETPPDDEDPFEQMSVGEIDEEALWSSLASDDAEADAPAASLGDVGPAPGVETVGGPNPETEEHVVPKRKYCQSCPYLDDPPALSCTHEGTEIMEVVDGDRFRVRNCPMVGDAVVDGPVSEE